MDRFIIIHILIAYILDIIVGDPYWLPHPVRFIGWLTKQTENVLRRGVEAAIKGMGVKRYIAERVAGAVLMLFVVSTTFLVVLVILIYAKRISPVLYHIANIYFIYSAFATRCLGDEAMKVYKPLSRNDLKGVRERVGMLVGRETHTLDESGVTRAVVETTAENTVDGVMSPIIYAVLGAFFGLAAPVVYAFKAASTLDSMVGYMNEKYMYLGTVSARFDDILNYIPARLSGLIIPMAAVLCGKDYKESLRIMLRDRRNHKSPNCAYPEAAVAGALGIQLGGPNIYFGRVVEKPVIGDAAKAIEINHIPATVRIMYVSSLITLAAGITALMMSGL